MLREFRSIKVQELRAEKADDGKQYLSGYAALYNSLSEDLGFWDSLYERILPGAFTRAIKEKQDVRHLINHDPNLVLGRTMAGTTTLSEDSKGLKFRTVLPDTSYARDLFESVSRGDMDECSFGFRAVKVGWLEEQEDPDDPKTMRTIRELHDLDLFDISTVTYPAYPGTISQAERAMFPDGVPAEIRSHMKNMKRDAADGDCACDCPECLDGDCGDCSNLDCADENCRCSDMRAARNAPAKTKRVDGEDLAPECFLITGDLNDTKTRKLPWKFSTEEKTTRHLHNCLVRFNETEGDYDKPAVWQKLVGLCKERSIDPTSDELKHIADRLTAEQLYDFQKDDILIAAQAKVRAIAASL